MRDTGRAIRPTPPPDGYTGHDDFPFPDANGALRPRS
jgi:hypothetical protein